MLPFLLIQIDRSQIFRLQNLQVVHFVSAAEGRFTFMTLGVETDDCQTTSLPKDRLVAVDFSLVHYFSQKLMLFLRLLNWRVGGYVCAETRLRKFT